MAAGRTPWPCGVLSPGEEGYIDISLPLPAAPPVPGDPPFSRHSFLNHATDGCEVASWSLCAHNATHIDFPAHFLHEGRRAGDYPPAAFILPALVVESGDALALTADMLDGHPPCPGEAILFRTVNSVDRLFAGPQFPETFAAVRPDLARELARRRTPLVGIDAMSIEPLDDAGYPVHHILLAAGVLILEGLDLRMAGSGRYRLICLPLAVPQAEASPVRAVLEPLPSCAGVSPDR